MDDLEAHYGRLLDRARDDPNVVGIVIFGSRVEPAFVTPRSDFDCFVVVREPAEDAWRHVRGSRVETVTATMEQMRAHARFGTPTFWNRPAFLRARVELDKTDGEVGRVVDEKRRLGADETPAVAREAAGAYINSLYRSLKNLRDGRSLAGRLLARGRTAAACGRLRRTCGRMAPRRALLRGEVAG